MTKEDFLSYIHPAVFVWFFLSSVITTRLIQSKFPLFLLAPIACASFLFTRELARAIWRVRWVILISVLVLPFATSGSVLLSAPFILTKEGITECCKQLIYLLTILSWWTLALSWMTAEAMLVGFLHVLSLFRVFWPGYHIFASRLAMTFEYAQGFIFGPPSSFRGLRLQLEQFLQDYSASNMNVTASVDFHYYLPLLFTYEKMAITIWVIFCSTFWLFG